MKIYNNQKGITMITLTVSVIILVIVSNILIYNAKDSINTKKLENLYNDIQTLRDKVIEYSIQYGHIPAGEELEYSIEGKDDLKNNWITDEEIRDGKFYVIDLKELDGLTLNYGKDYEKITETSSKQEINQLTDVYIVNDISNNIFYVEGINVEGKRYYTDREKDETTVDLKYENGEGLPYFSASANKRIVDLYNGYASVKVTLKNYKNDNITAFDGEYELKLKNDEKFEIEIEDKNEGIIKGGQKSENIINVNITSVPNVILNSKEEIEIIVIIKEPVYKEITLPLDITIPGIISGYMNNFRKVRYSDVHDDPNIDEYNKMYGGSDNEFEYADDGSIVLDEDNIIPVFDRTERNYENGYTLYITIKGDTSQYTTDRWGIPTIFAMSDDQNNIGGIPNRLCWIGFNSNMLHVYSYYNEQPVQNCNYEYEKPGFISKNVSAYSNKIMNIQITGINGGKTNVYINGQLFASFDSGSGTGSFNQAIIGDLRPQRGVKFTGNLYDIAIYNRVLSEDELNYNWNYAKNWWDIT